MSVAEEIVFEEKERVDKMKIPVIALIKTLDIDVNVTLRFWRGDEFFDFHFHCVDSYNAALKELPNLEEMIRNYVVDRIYTDNASNMIEISCVRKEEKK